jgi:hypothetical protein
VKAVGAARRVFIAKYGSRDDINKCRFPTTPEGWVEYREMFLAVEREEGMCSPEWGDPTFDNWRLWVELQSRKSSGGARYVTRDIGLLLPLHCKDGKPDQDGLAKSCRITARTVKRHLERLSALGADFTRIRDWPHPLAQSERTFEAPAALREAARDPGADLGKGRGAPGHG